MGFEVYPQHEDVDVGGNAEQDVREPTGEWGWRYRAEGNDAISAVGGEGFTSEEHAERAVLTFVEAVAKEIAGADSYETTLENAAAIEIKSVDR